MKFKYLDQDSYYEQKSNELLIATLQCDLDREYFKLNSIEEAISSHKKSHKTTLDRFKFDMKMKSLNQRRQDCYKKIVYLEEELECCRITAWVLENDL